MLIKGNNLDILLKMEHKTFDQLIEGLLVKIRSGKKYYSVSKICNYVVQVFKD